MNTLKAAAVVAMTVGLSGSALALPMPTNTGGPSPIQCEIEMMTTSRA